MAEIPNQLKNGAKKILLKFVTKIIPSFFLSLILFAGGIVLLVLRIPGWSLILGLPAVQISFILSLPKPVSQASPKAMFCIIMINDEEKRKNFSYLPSL